MFAAMKFESYPSSTRMILTQRWQKRVKQPLEFMGEPKREQQAVFFAPRSAKLPQRNYPSTIPSGNSSKFHSIENLYKILSRVQYLVWFNALCLCNFGANKNHIKAQISNFDLFQCFLDYSSASWNQGGRDFDYDMSLESKRNVARAQSLQFSGSGPRVE